MTHDNESRMRLAVCHRILLLVDRNPFFGIKLYKDYGCVSMTYAAHNIVTADFSQVCILCGD